MKFESLGDSPLDTANETLYSEDGGNVNASMYRRRRASDVVSVHTIRDNEGHEMILFLSDDGKTTWELHSSVFAPESALFARMFEHGRAPMYGAVDPCESLIGLARLPGYRNGYRLRRVSNDAFEAFLLAVRPKLGQKPTASQLVPILTLATDWAFPDVRKYALKEIPKTPMDPIDKIALSRRTQVPEWIEAPYIALSLRNDMLSTAEAMALGLGTTAAVTRARERVLHRRMRLTSGVIPPWMGNFFFHALCWRTLREAWGLALTDEKYRSMIAAEALLAALTEIRTRGSPKVFCTSCNDEKKLLAWLDKEDDERVALAELMSCLGNDVRTWLDKK